MEQTIPQSDCPRIVFSNKKKVMSEIPIKTEGYCINKFIHRVRSKIGQTAADQLKQTAVEVVQNCINVYSQKRTNSDI
jgi:hypothetical protein